MGARQDSGGPLACRRTAEPSRLTQAGSVCGPTFRQLCQHQLWDIYGLLPPVAPATIGHDQRRSEGSVDRTRRQVELRWRRWGRGWKEQEAPGLVSEAWLATQMAPGSAANPREEHDTPPSPLFLPANQERVWVGEGGGAVQGQHF